MHDGTCTWTPRKKREEGSLLPEVLDMVMNNKDETREGVHMLHDLHGDFKKAVWERGFAALNKKR